MWLLDPQKAALEDGVQAYRGVLGIALSDAFGRDASLADFDLYAAKLSESPGKTLCNHQSCPACLRPVAGIAA